MRRLIIATALVLTLAMSVNAYAWTISGTFGLPFDPNQHWNDCPSTAYNGYKNPADQIFMQWNSDLKSDGTPKGYHMAEDWNGKCGGSTDMGVPLYAIGDGFVKDVQDPGGSKIGKSLIVR